MREDKNKERRTEKGKRVSYTGACAGHDAKYFGYVSVPGAQKTTFAF